MLYFYTKNESQTNEWYLMVAENINLQRRTMSLKVVLSKNS